MEYDDCKYCKYREFKKCELSNCDFSEVTKTECENNLAYENRFSSNDSYKDFED